MDKVQQIRYNAAPPLYTRNFMPPKSDLVYPSLDDFVDVNESVSEFVVEILLLRLMSLKKLGKRMILQLLRIGTHKNVINNAYSTARRPFNKITAVNNSNFTKKVNTVKGTMVNTTRPKAVLSAVKGNKGNDVKASACWVWRPKHKVLDHVSRNNGASMSFKIFDYIDAQDRSKKHVIMKKLMKDLLPLEVILKEEKLLGKKNSVLFTDTECVVLSPNFKLTDGSHVLLKVSRKDNMYSVDLKNVVLQGGLICLFAKATSDEFNLWHRRLVHVNFKTINKLVKGNLVRGLPSKLF
ncbi:ribonuclease H-like domain-containing protein [Tanacetum coccineum]